MAYEQRDLLINFNGQTLCVKGVTRYTTCDDLIEMVFYNTSKSVESYAIFESSCGVERMLYGKERILKIVRSWDVEQNSFTLVLRELDNIKSNMATLSKARRKLRKMRSQNAKLDNNTIQANRDNLNNKTMKDKNIENLEKMQRRERSGKLGILKRFLSDAVLHSKKQRKEIQSVVMIDRTPGDGCDANIIQSNTGELNTSALEQLNVTFNDSLRHCNSYMNAAFVDCDDTDVHVIALEDDIESAFEDYSDADSVCGLERNIVDISLSDCEDITELESDNEGKYTFCSAEHTVIEHERIRDMFNTAQIDEHDNGDEGMQSFMKTLVYDSEHDEGLSSLDSDDE